MDEPKPASIAFRAYRDSIPDHLWTPELGEGFFKGWEACEARVDQEVRR